MKTIANRKWLVRDRELGAQIRTWLLDHGGESERVSGAAELWRVGQSGAKWTYYTTGTLYVTGSDDPALLEAQRQIELLAGMRFAAASRDVLIGLDETGKGEIFGPVVLAAVVLPRSIFRQLEEVIGVADTKVRHSPRFWEELFGRIDFYRAEGLGWKTGRISPAEMECASVNQLLDRGYRTLLAAVLEKAEAKQCRIVLDDYGAGSGLVSALREAVSHGAEVVRVTRADDRYLECRLASLVAKREQQQTLESIRRDTRFQLEGRELGSGNAGDPQTLAWLRAWHQTGRPWPDFVKQSFRTVQEIEGRPARAAKRRSID